MAALNEITFTPESQTGSDVHATKEPAPSFWISFPDGNKASYATEIDGNPNGTWGWVNGAYTPGSSSLGGVVIPAPNLTDGSHALTVTEILPHPQTVPSFLFVVDTQAPPQIPAPHLASFSQTPGNPLTTPFANPKIDGTALPRAQVVLVVDGSTGAGGAVADANGVWRASTTNLLPGPHTVAAQQMDAAGNASPVSDPFAFSVVPPAGVDLTPPSPVGNLALTITTRLAWTPSTDNVGVAKYVIKRNLVKIGETTGLSFTDPNGHCGDSWMVVAVDAAGNESAGVFVNLA